MFEKMAIFFFVQVVLFFFIPLVLSSEDLSNQIGINYGRLGNNLPSNYRSIQLIKSMKTSYVKLYDADRETLQLLAGTNIHVSIMIRNRDIIAISRNQNSSDTWVRRNVLPYYPETMIRFILVGNEVLTNSSDENTEIWNHLVPAMRRIKNSVRAAGIKNIKVGTPLGMDVLQTTYPPSSGMFRHDISDSVMTPLLKLLNGTNSFFFINAYPYKSWSDNPTRTSIDFAVFKGNRSRTDLGSGLIYTNLLDQMLDSVFFAMARLGYPEVGLAISETGWPYAGDYDQPGANIRNSATYNRNLIKKMTTNPPLGTPARPGSIIPTFISSLFDENLKTGVGSERHSGVVYPNGRSVYPIDLTGKRSVSSYGPLPEATVYKGKIWCVSVIGASLVELRRALDSTCSRGNDTCAALAPGRECYAPVSVPWHASYAFSSYWSKFRSKGATCDFNGLAVQTTDDPGHRRCQLPSVTV